MELRRGSLAITASVLAVLLAVWSIPAGSSTPPTGPVPSTAPGVSARSIIVGSLATASGALAGQFGQIVYGVKAYFDAVDAKGGALYRALLGGFASNAEAAAFCKTLSAAGKACIVRKAP